MADNIQGQPGTDATPTAAETTPVTPQPAPVETGATEAPTAAPNPASAPEGVDWGKVDAGTYADFKKQLQEGKLPAQAAASAPEEVPTDPPTEVAKAEEPTPPPAKPADDEDIPNRFRFSDPKDKAIAALKKANPELSWSEAEERVTGKPARAATEPAPEQAPESPAAIQAKIDGLKEERRKAGDMADTVKLAEISDQIDAAKDALADAKTREKDAARQHESAQMRDIEAAKTEVRGKYPAIKDQNSPLAKRFNEIFDQWEAKQSPFLQLSPAEQMTTAAKLAAADLGIAPVDPNAQAAPAAKVPSSAIPQSQPSARPVLPASGASRTATPTNAAAQISQRIDSVKSMEEYEALKQEVLSAR